VDKTKNLTVRFISDTSKWRTTKIDTDIKKLMNSEKLLKAENQKLRNQLKGTEDALGGLGGKGGGGGSVPTLTQRLTKMSGALGFNITRLLGWAGAAYAATKGLRALFSAGIQTEGQISKLTVLLGGSAPKALAMYQKALKFSVITPFDPRDVVDAAVVAGQYGADAFVTGLYGMKGDIATLVADMASFSGQTMEQAATALMRGDLALLEKYGAAGRAAYKTAKEAGELGSTAFLQTFVKEMSNVPLWMGMAEKKSQTMSGLWSTIQGNVGLIFTYLSGAGEGGGAITFWSNMKNIVKDFSDGFGSFVDMIRPLLVDTGTLLGNIFGVVWSFAKLIWTQIKPVAYVLGVVLYGALRGTMWVLNVILEATMLWFGAIGKIIKAFQVMTGNVFDISSGLQSLWGWTNDIILQVQMGGFFLKRLFTELTDDIVKFIMNIPNIFTSIGSGISGYFSSQKNKILGVLNFGKSEDQKGSTFDTVADAVLNPIDTFQKFLANSLVNQATAPRPVAAGASSSVTSVQNQTDNSSTITNVFNQGNDRPEWLIEDPHDITGRPRVAF